MARLPWVFLQLVCGSLACCVHRKRSHLQGGQPDHLRADHLLLRLCQPLLGQPPVTILPRVGLESRSLHVQLLRVLHSRRLLRRQCPTSIQVNRARHKLHPECRVHHEHPGVLPRRLDHHLPGLCVPVQVLFQEERYLLPKDC